MDSYTAIPDITRMPIEVVDQEKLAEWYDNPNLDAPVPTITKIFVCYGKGPGTPVPIQIEVDKVETEYVDNLPDDADREKLTPAQYYDKSRRVDMLLRRNLLLAVIKGMDADSANVLAKEDNGKGREILVKLGWLMERSLDKTESENEQEGEGVTGS